MPRPSTLPAPWSTLADICGGVGRLSLALGCTPRTLLRWSHGQHTPEGPARVLIRQTFESHGLESPV